MNLNFDINTPTILCEIMGRNQSDKGNKNIKTSHHNYTTVYYNLFKDLQTKHLRIFELGLGTNNINIPSNMGINGRPGASLYGWCEFFVNSEIYGADIDTNILFNTDKIKTFYCDQTNSYSIKYMWSQPDLTENFDIIVEDGLHTFDANVCFFENSIHKLKPNGYFIIEDIEINQKNLFENKIKEWTIKYPELLFKFIIIPSYVNNGDNNIILIYKNSV